MKRLVSFVKTIYTRYIDHQVPALSAQVAYFSLLSIFPFLIFIMTIVARSPLNDVDVISPLANVLPYETYIFLRDNLEHVASNRNLELVSFGLVAALWAASNGVRAIIVGLNRAYDKKEKRSFLKIKLVSITFTLALSFVIILYFVLLIFGNRLGDFFTSLGLSQNLRLLWDRLRVIVPIFLMVVVFAALYKFTPCSRLRWRDVLPGAVFTSVGWFVASIAFSYYVDNFWNIELLYGSIGGIIALLIWLYLSAMLLILGGQINAILADGRNKGIDSCK
ncbi:MAG TPA: YihY/virulence factor BrkB family protein [Bacillota bacterium]|nr:YihY/virulence factor BrkB family protein [Bacillota bacterium]